MILYFADRKGQVIHSVSSDNPGTNQIISDSVSDDVTTGFRILEASFLCDEELRAAAVPGNFVMQGGKDYELYTITEAEYSAGDRTVSIYAEDAGLDLIGKTVGEWKPNAAKTIVEALTATLGSSFLGWSVNYGISKTKTVSGLEYTGDETAVSRLSSIAEAFGAELFFSYDIDGFNFVNRFINIVPHRGSKKSVHTFKIGVDLDNITEKSNINDLATAFLITGKDGKKLSKLKSYDTYSGITITPDDDRFNAKRTHTYKVSGNEVQCVEAMKEWATALSPSGKVIKRKDTEYTYAIAAINYAMREMEKVLDIEYAYEISFVSIPEGIEAGDTIRIIDEEDQLYLQSRIISWKKSETAGTFEAEIGDFTRLKGSKADIDYSRYNVCTLSITSDNGTVFKNKEGQTVLSATVFYNGNVINTVAGLTDQIGPGTHIIWEKDGSEVARDVFSITVLASGIEEKSIFSCSVKTE